ncbi:MAG: M48 family metallopeptidase [Alphaproteobacteria bacterium]|nr:M48 family metallopeptidase [Alphaproteobacteria bacterium]
MSVFVGRFFDGRTAAPREVTVRLGRRALELVDVQGAALASWGYQDLRLVAPGSPGLPLRLTSVTSPGARLSVADHRILGPLRQRAPRLGAGGFVVGRVRPRQVVLAAVVVAGFAALLVAAPRLAEPLVALVPLEWEESLGAEVVAELELFGGPCSEPAADAALEALAGKLAAAAESPYRITVHVLDAKFVNALAAPGGHVVLLAGLIEEAESADEVAGVLAHEIGHVVNRHPLEGLVRNLGISLIVESLIGDSASLIELAADLGTVLIEASYSREDEAAADRAAVEILARANFRAGGLASFFERLAAKEGAPERPGLAGYFSTHPPSAERQAAIAARAGQGGDAALGPAEWRALKAICEGRGADS